MTPEVSVIMPAFGAEATIVEAVRSAIDGQGVVVELVLCADDLADYREILSRAGCPIDAVVFCRTEQAQSGPSAARNIAMEAARAPVIAALDADDAYAAGRLRGILDAMDRFGVGAGTGPTLEGARGAAPDRVARARGDRLRLSEICGLRMPFSPVFARDLAPGWPPVAFAEDMVLNAHLSVAAGGYAYAPDAAYRYHVEPGSMVQGKASLRAALRGYSQIEGWLPTSWVAPEAQEEILRVIGEDRITAERALASGHANWRAAFRDA